MRLLQGEGLLTEERTELLLSWRHTGFSVHNRVRVEPEDKPAVERLARYIMRPPISLERMAWGGVGEVRYRRKGGHESSGAPVAPVEAFDPLEFLARVIMHIPEPRRHLVRYLRVVLQRVAGQAAEGGGRARAPGSGGDRRAVPRSS
jgi:hypothetical protein